MKKTNFIKYGLFVLVLSGMGCASNQGGSGDNVIGSVSSGLASVEHAAQTGGQMLDSGTAVANAASNVDGTDLTNILTSQLGVSQQQALGGAGAIFQAAQAGMTPESFATLSQTVPGINNMLNAAPVVSGAASDLTEGLSAMMGDSNNTLGGAASLITSFQQLDLSPEMLGQFIPVVTNYVQDTSGQLTANLLQSVLPMP